MESWQIVLVVLVAVLVGSLIPVLLQLRATLRQVERRLRRTGMRLDRTLDEAHGAAVRVNRVLAGLDGGEKQVASLLTSMGQLAHTLDRVRGTVNVASAVGAAIAPAVVAMVRGLGEESADGSRQAKGSNGRHHEDAHPSSDNEENEENEEKDHG